MKSEETLNQFDKVNNLIMTDLIRDAELIGDTIVLNKFNPHNKEHQLLWRLSLIAHACLGFKVELDVPFYKIGYYANKFKKFAGEKNNCWLLPSKHKDMKSCDELCKEIYETIMYEGLGEISLSDIYDEYYGG